MKALRTAIFASLMLGFLLIAGCGDNKQIAEVKGLPFSYPSDNVQDPNMTVDQALDYRKICDSVKWKVDQTEQHQTFVQYTCTYKGIQDSAFIANAKAQHPTNSLIDSAGDVYQWTYGADGKPQLSYVALHYHFTNGNEEDLTRSDSINGTYVDGALWMTVLMEMAVSNKAEDFDQFLSELYGVPIPPKPEAPHPIQETASVSSSASNKSVATGFANGTPPAAAASTPAAQPVQASSNQGGLDACEQSWTDAFHKESGQDAAISQDQLNEWDGWCKRGYDASKGVPPDA